MREAKRCYSAAQKEAIETFGKELCVSAGAGSGKTSVLVERFLYAVVKKKIEPERILAITFTEKAANEMKTRLVCECRERGLADFRRRLETCYISTIHGFCSRLLKENPIEAGVDPYFQILSAGEAQILKHQVLDRLFESSADNVTRLAALSDYGEEKVRKMIIRFHEMVLSSVEGADIFKRRDLSSRTKEVLEEVRKEAEGLSERLGPDEKTKTAAEMKESLEKILEILTPRANPDWTFLETLNEAKRGLKRNLSKYKEEVNSLHALLDVWISLALESMGEPTKMEFEKMCAEFGSLYEEEKKFLAAYDFEDLMAKAVNLLSGRTSEKKAVRERIRGHFECILVDEYQDTSPLQDRLIELLKKKDNLFIVGDVQQSIYGFRSADPEMFMRRTREKGPLTKHIRLDDNYRSRKDILGFINGFFQEFADVLLFRPLTAKKAFLPAKTPAVQWLCVPRDKSEPIDTDGARVIEARSIAGAIREVIKEGFRYGDIAVLFRSSKKSYLYEQELINASIPFSAARGGGFYSKPEILDLINFLRLIEDPAKDIALAAVLRSPLVGLSDDGLYWMARFAKGEDSGTPLAFALDRPRKIKGLSAPDLEKLEKFGAFLDDLRKQKERLGLSEMIERIINETVYDAKVLVREEGNQRLANSLKLIHIAHTLEDKNIVGIRDFVRYAERLAENEIEEEEARIADDAENTVTLSTIHAAKGLEFPVVIVADLGRGMKSSQRNVMLCLPGFGLGLKHVCPWGKDPLKDTSYSEIETILKEKEEKEEAQLLYVAMTRAKERLILSGSLPVNEGPSWMDRIARAISWESGSALAECNFNNIPIKVLNVARGPVESPAEPQIKEAPAIFSDKQAFIDLKKRLKPVVKAYEPSEDRTVTDLLIAAKPAAPVIIIEKDLEAPEDGMPRNEYGTLYHRVMEYTMTLARRKVISLSDIPLSVIRPLSQAQQKELKESVVKFWRGPWGKLAWGAKKRYSELPFIFRTPRGILKGQIDLILQTQSGDWLILDYKTNQITASQKKVVAREYETQIRIYAFIFMKLYGEAPIKGVLYFTAIDDVVEFQYSSKGLDSYEPELNTLFSKAIPIC